MSDAMKWGAEKVSEGARYVRDNPGTAAVAVVTAAAGFAAVGPAGAVGGAAFGATAVEAFSRSRKSND